MPVARKIRHASRHVRARCAGGTRRGILPTGANGAAQRCQSRQWAATQGEDRSAPKGRRLANCSPDLRLEAIARAPLPTFIGLWALPLGGASSSFFWRIASNLSNSRPSYRVPSRPRRDDIWASHSDLAVRLMMSAAAPKSDWSLADANHDREADSFWPGHMSVTWIAYLILTGEGGCLN
jgi:hypothetical protein